MCELSRVNSVFVDRIDCEEGKRLRRSMIDARLAYLNYIGSEEQSQELYNAYDQAKAAYDKHIAESQGMKSF